MTSDRFFFSTLTAKQWCHTYTAVSSTTNYKYRSRCVFSPRRSWDRLTNQTSDSPRYVFTFSFRFVTYLYRHDTYLTYEMFVFRTSTRRIVITRQKTLQMCVHSSKNERRLLRFIWTSYLKSMAKFKKTFSNVLPRMTNYDRYAFTGAVKRLHSVHWRPDRFISRFDIS